MVYLPGLPGFNYYGHGCGLSRLHQMLMYSGHRQQRGYGYVVFIHSAVREDEDVGPLPVDLVHLYKQPPQHPLHRRALIKKDRHHRDLKALLVHVAYL